MGDFAKWAVIAVVAFLAFRWLRVGVGASATLGPLGGAGNSWGGGIYGPSGYAAYHKAAWWQSIPLNVDYSNDGAFDVSYGYGGYGY